MNSKNVVEMELMLDVLKESGTVTLPVQGRSMLPFLKEGRDKVFLSLPDGNCRKGDIVVYRRGRAYVMHRIISVGENTVSIIGDNEINPDNGVSKESIAAVVKKAERRGRIINEKSLVWKFYASVYIRPLIRKAFLKLHKVRKG